MLFSDIRYLFFNTDSKKIDHLVTLIHDYEEVAAFGEGYSETAALNFQHKMSFTRSSFTQLQMTENK